MAQPLSITLKPEIKPIIKFGFIFQGVIILLSIGMLVYFALTIANDILLLSLLTLGSAFFFFFIAKKYFENIFFSEKVIVTYNTLTIIHKSLRRERKHEFQLRDILYLGYAGTKSYTNNNMQNSVVDFTGLGTTERELQFLIDDGAIELETESQVFRFGKNMTSWNTEELIKKIEDHLGKKFINKYTPVLYE